VHALNLGSPCTVRRRCFTCPPRQPRNAELTPASCENARHSHELSANLAGAARYVLKHVPHSFSHALDLEQLHACQKASGDKAAIGLAIGDRVHCKLARGARGSVEIYRRAERYITVTGDQLGTCYTLTTIDDAIDALAPRLTATQLIIEAEEARQLAMRIKQPGAAIAAVTCRAKLAGHWKEHTVLTGKDGAAAVLEVIWPGMPVCPDANPAST
jgi:hypothetical protein